MRLVQSDTKEYTESYGMFLEDFEVGWTIKHRPGRTILDADNTWLTLLSMNLHPLHFNVDYAKGTEFGRVLVNSVVTFAIVNGMTVQSLSAKTIANLGWDNVRLVSPVYVGDTLYAASEILGVRPSKSRPTQGVVTVRTTGYNADERVVISYERSFLAPKRGSVAL